MDRIDLFWGSIVIGIGFIFLLFPAKVARLRSRNARDPTPTEAAILNIMVAGFIFIIIGIIGLWAS